MSDGENCGAEPEPVAAGRSNVEQPSSVEQRDERVGVERVDVHYGSTGRSRRGQSGHTSAGSRPAESVIRSASCAVAPPEWCDS